MNRTDHFLIGLIVVCLIWAAINKLADVASRAITRDLDEETGDT